MEKTDEIENERPYVIRNIGGRFRFISLINGMISPGFDTMDEDDHGNETVPPDFNPVSSDEMNGADTITA